MFSAGQVSAVLEGRFSPAGFMAFDAAMKKSAASMEAGEKRMTAAGTRGSKAMGLMGKAGALAAGGGVLALGLALGKSVKAAADFEKSMRNVNTIAKVSEQRLGALGKQVLKLATQTGQAPTDLAAGLYDIVSSGFKASDAMKILEKSAVAAAAGMTTTETSTKAVVAVLNAYGMGADKAGVVSDQLFGIVDRGVITFEELAGQIGDLLPYAPKLGLGLEQLGGAIATITKGGTNAAETMTQIKGVMVQFIGPNDALAAAIKRTGFATGEQLVKSKGLQGALEAVAGTTDGTSTAMRSLFPEIRGLSGALALTGSKAKGANEDLKAMADVSGKTQAALAEQSKGAEFQWNRFKAAIKVAGIELGTGLLPGLTKGLKSFSQTLAEMSESGKLEQLGQDLGDIVTTLVEAGPAISEGLKGGIDGIGLGIRAAQAALLPFVEGLAGAVTIVTAMVEAFNALPLGAKAEINTDGLKAARDNVQQIAKSMREDVLGIGKAKPEVEVKIKGNSADAERALKRVQGMGLSDKVMKILARDGDAKSKIKALIALGIPEKLARILGQNADAIAKIGSVQAALNAIQDKTVTLRVNKSITELVDRRNANSLSKTKPKATGRAPGAPERALVGEGKGPELHVDELGRMQVIDRPTIMDLGAGDYVIPYGDPGQKGRALGLMLDMFGIKGYHKGKRGHTHQKGGKGGKPLPIPDAVKFGGVPADELDKSRDDAREAYQDRKERVRKLDVKIREQQKAVGEAKGTDAKRKARGKLADLREDRRNYSQGKGGVKSSLAEMRKRWQELQRQSAELHRVNREIEKLNTQQETDRTKMATASKMGDAAGWKAARDHRGGLLATLRDKYALALKYAKPGTNFAAEVEGKLAGIQGDIADLGSEDFTSPFEGGLSADERKHLEGLQAAQALASLTAPLDDDKAAASATEQFLSQMLGAAISDPNRGGPAAIRDLADQVKQARDNVASFAGGGAGGGATNDNADVQAQLEQEREAHRVTRRESEINRLGLATFQGAGDIGMGGRTVQNIYTLHPGDPATLRAIGDAAVGGIALQPAVQSSRTSLGL
jgi:TP901 family phage tail tape measure protein